MTTSCMSRLGPLSTPDFDDSRLTIISLDRQAMIDEFDLDQDGEISEHEFIAFVPFPRKHPRADQILGSWPTTFNPLPPHATVFYPLHIGSPHSLHVHESMRCSTTTFQSIRNRETNENEYGAARID